MSLDELATTRSDAQRNRLAIDLKIAGVPGLAEAIAAAIRNHPLPRNFGTPIFVLNEIEGSLPLSLAVKALLSGSFETKVEVLELLQDSRFTANPSDVTAAIDALVGIDPDSSLGHEIVWVIAGLRRLSPA